jgi:hypothetical protein
MASDFRIKTPNGDIDRPRDIPRGGTPRNIDDKGNVLARDLSPNTPDAVRMQTEMLKVLKKKG